MRIDVKHTATRVGLGLRARAHQRQTRWVTGHTVGVGDLEARFIVGVGFEIEHTARKHIRHDDIDT